MEIDSDPDLSAILSECKLLEKEVKEKALMRAKVEGLDKDPKFQDPSYHYYNDLEAYSLYKCAFYTCFKCRKPYFGGLKDCNAEEIQGREHKPEELVCAACSAVAVGAGVKNCNKHGTDFIDYKCKFCCSVAMWFCWGTTHFCDPCHRVAGRNVNAVCKGPGKCDLGEALQNHPPNGEEYALGCNVCRSEAILGSN